MGTGHTPYFELDIYWRQLVPAGSPLTVDGLPTAPVQEFARRVEAAGRAFGQRHGRTCPKLNAHSLQQWERDRIGKPLDLVDLWRSHVPPGTAAPEGGLAGPVLDFAREVDRLAFIAGDLEARTRTGG